jgi:hypothetical protein
MVGAFDKQAQFVADAVESASIGFEDLGHRWQRSLDAFRSNGGSGPVATPAPPLAWFLPGPIRIRGG